MVMGRLFRRRDTLFLAIGVGGLLACGPLLFGIGEYDYRPILQPLLALLVWCLVTAIILWLRRDLPSDIVLNQLPADEARHVRDAPIAEDRTTLLLSIERDRLRGGRLDVLIDDRPVAQLRTGMGCVLLLRPGLHRLTIMYFQRSVSTGRIINAIPGMQIGLHVRIWGTRPTNLLLEPHAGFPPGTRLVYPVAPEV